MNQNSDQAQRNSAPSLGVQGGFGRPVAGQKFKSDNTLGLINGAHAPAVQLLNHVVTRDGLADELERDSHWRKW